MKLLKLLNLKIFKLLFIFIIYTIFFNTNNKNYLKFNNKENIKYYLNKKLKEKNKIYYEYNNNVSFINLSEIIKLLPEYKILEKKIYNIYKFYDIEFKKIILKIKKKIKKYEEEMPYKSQKINKNREREIFIFKKKIENYKKKINYDLMKKRISLMNKIFEKINNYIKKIIKKYPYIIRVYDCSKDENILFNLGKDLTNDLKKELKLI
ncbi:OmpH family outer membrane protein [Candidatus Shikimatogenerans silvanidophilus]|uniref:OmpH family outer membrane protein n=1 Tax=Candidatus Shikimatogenerans silvanidophilus TaxID=2782547 RepID=UPI001BA6A75B|nr:OmpH family outer membrane protein [Candidatus Shikimatogenerans silvanidophilus]